MTDPSLSAPITGEELHALRRRSGFPRLRYCGELGITGNQLIEFERGTRVVPGAVAARAGLLDGQGSSTIRVAVATFGDQFVVTVYSLLEEVGRWRPEVLPIVHDHRASAVIAARDYAAKHGYEFSAFGV